MLPSLGKILDNLGSSSPAQDCIDAQQRLNYLLCQFVGVICNCSDNPLVIFLDDVQWADSASISLIGQILKAGVDQQLFFLGCCREDEMQDHLFWDELQSAASRGYKDTRIKLDCIDSETLEQVLSSMLHLTPRLVR